MTRIRIKRVYAPEEAGDGFRVLVDRMWPRGMCHDEVHYDLWAKQISPSPALRQWYHAEPETRWEEFCCKYMDELRASADVRTFLKTIRKKPVVTLLFASKKTTENHALVLQEYLTKALAAACKPESLTVS